MVPGAEKGCRRISEWRTTEYILLQSLLEFRPDHQKTSYTRRCRTNGCAVQQNVSYNWMCRTTGCAVQEDVLYNWMSYNRGSTEYHTILCYAMIHYTTLYSVICFNCCKLYSPRFMVIRGNSAPFISTYRHSTVFCYRPLFSFPSFVPCVGVFMEGRRGASGFLYVKINHF
jgi:hypothetical protein